MTRLYPGFWICCTISALVAFADPLLGWPEYFYNMTVLPDQAYVKLINQAYWTLFIEATFYLLIAVLILCGALRRIEGVKWGSLRKGCRQAACGSTLTCRSRRIQRGAARPVRPRKKGLCAGGHFRAAFEAISLPLRPILAPASQERIRVNFAREAAEAGIRISGANQPQVRAPHKQESQGRATTIRPGDHHQIVFHFDVEAEVLPKQ